MIIGSVIYVGLLLLAKEKEKELKHFCFSAHVEW